MSEMSDEDKERAAKMEQQYGMAPPPSDGGSQGGLVLEAKSEDSLQLIDMRKQLNGIPDALWIESATNTLEKVCAYLKFGVDDNCTMETGYGNGVPEKPKNMLTRTIMNKLLIPLFNTSIKKEELIRKFTEYDEIEEEVDNPLEESGDGSNCKCEKKGEKEQEEGDDVSNSSSSQTNNPMNNNNQGNDQDDIKGDTQANSDITEPLSVALSLQNAQNNKMVGGGMFGKDYGCGNTPSALNSVSRNVFENLPPVKVWSGMFKDATGMDLKQTKTYKGHVDHAATFFTRNFIRFQTLDPGLVTKILTEEREYLKSIALCLAQDFGISEQEIKAKMVAKGLKMGGAPTEPAGKDFVLNMIVNLNKKPEDIANEFVPINALKEQVDEVKKAVSDIPGAEAVLGTAAPDSTSSAGPSSAPGPMSAMSAISESNITDSTDAPSSSTPSMPPPTTSGDPASGVFKSEDGLSNMDALSILNYWEDKVKTCITCNKSCHDKIEQFAIQMMEISMKEILINKEDFYEKVFDNHIKFGTKKFNDEKIDTRLKYIELLKPSLNDKNTVKLYLILLGELHYYYFIRQTYEKEDGYGNNYADNEVKKLLGNVNPELINAVKGELGTEHTFNVGFYKILKLDPPDAVGGKNSMNFDDFFLGMFGGNTKNKKNNRRTKKRRPMKNNYTR